MSALLAAQINAPMRCRGCSCPVVSAQDAASTSRPAKKCPQAVAASILKTCGSSGLRRIARATCSIAVSGSPSHTFVQPLNCHAIAKLGLSATARLIMIAPSSRLLQTKVRPSPAVASATASSRPSSAARSARRLVSDISNGRSVSHPHTLR
jgi:hypothetical protein